MGNEQRLWGRRASRSREGRGFCSSLSLFLSLFFSLVIESARAPPDGTQEMPRSALRRSAEALALVAVFLDLGEQASVLSLFEVVPLARSLALSVDVVGRRNQSACLPLFFFSLSLSLSRARARARAILSLHSTFSLEGLARLRPGVVELARLLLLLLKKDGNEERRKGVGERED